MSKASKILILPNDEKYLHESMEKSLVGFEGQ
jgi:hypothetical protein